VTDTTSGSKTPPPALASALTNAPFVRLIASDDGDALAAAGVLARALRELSVPFQVRVASDPTPAADGDSADSADLVVAVGVDRGPHAIVAASAPASTTAFDTARELGVEPDPVTTLAGVVAAGAVPATDAQDALEAAVDAALVSRRPGVAVPTTDLAGDLAASTLIRCPYSGDPEAARAAVETLSASDVEDEDAQRRLASVVAVDSAAAPDASERSATAVERALRPYAIDADHGPFETVGGYADVLDALARETPGAGVALVLTSTPTAALLEAATETWRTHGTAAHRALNAATTARYDGCFVARVDADPSVLPTVARLARDFVSPEPTAVALDESSGRIAVSATDAGAVGDACRTAAAAVDGTGWGTPSRGGLVADDPSTGLEALRGAL